MYELGVSFYENPSEHGTDGLRHASGTTFNDETNFGGRLGLASALWCILGAVGAEERPAIFQHLCDFGTLQL